jgi:hypothetical protein
MSTPLTQFEDLFTEIAGHLNHTDNVEKGNMFGAKCLKMNKKAFAMYYKGDMVFKLPANEPMLALDGARPFEPMPGRPMNGWVQVPNRYSGQWEALAVRALEVLRQ